MFVLMWTKGASGAAWRAASSRARAERAASSSTFPGAGRWTGTGATRRAVTVPSGRTTLALTALLPTSITRMLILSLPEPALAVRQQDVSDCGEGPQEASPSRTLT